jgi:ferric-dicitrate binding protein FerR (iron transport regulator)
MNVQDQFNTLSQLTAALCEGVISSDESQRLGELLRASATAREFYLDYVTLHGILAWDLAPAGTIAEARSFAPLHDVAFHESLSDLLPQFDSLTIASPIEPRILSRRNVYLATIGTVTAVCAAAVLAVLLMPTARRAELATRTLISSASTPLSEAVLVANADRQLRTISASGAPRASSLLYDGDTLELDSGTATLVYQSGVKVIVRGPIRMRVEAGSNYLQRGALIANVPTKAIGFAVETPQARVVDLGTEFAVQADEKGTTEVQVYKGKVEFSPITQQGNSSAIGPAVILEAGTARRIEPTGSGGGIVTREVAFTPELFRQNTSASQSGQIKIEGAYASSTPLIQEINVNNLIGGQGMKGDCHSARCQNTMWTAEYMRIKDEFVLFDLARPHRLESMKVWNWNEPELLWICLKRADIYVSTSGKGDPLSRPDEWKLMVAKQEFAQGTGKHDYDTPTVIPLGNVEARFVGIVIDDAYGRDPRGPEVKHDCVGLSEVRFFGSRVENRKRSGVER